MLKWLTEAEIAYEKKKKPDRRGENKNLILICSSTAEIRAPLLPLHLLFKSQDTVKNHLEVFAH